MERLMKTVCGGRSKLLSRASLAATLLGLASLVPAGVA